MSDPHEVARLALLQIDALNAKKDELTLALTGLTDLTRQFVRTYAEHTHTIQALGVRVKALEAHAAKGQEPLPGALMRSAILPFMNGVTMSHDNATSPLPRTRAKRQPTAGWRAHLALAALALLLGGPTFAASFPCEKAQSPVEKMICADAELSAMDEALAAAYRQALDITVDKDALQHTQREWLAKTRNACPDRACLLGAYQARLAQLAPSGEGTSSTEAATGKAAAGRYELVKGKGVEVCEAYARNLNSFKPTEPMRCDRPVNSKFGDFQKPVWKQVDAPKEFELILKADQLLEPNYYKHGERLRESRIQGLRGNIEIDNYRFSLVTIDIDNDGQAEPVLRYLDSCWPGSKGPWGTPLVVLQQDKQDVDQTKSELVAKGHGVTGYHGSIYDVFRYKGKTYFDYWSEEDGPLRVMFTQQGETKEVCQLHFKSE